MIINRDHLWKIAFRLLMRQFVHFFYPDKYDEVDWIKGIEFLDKELHKLHTQSSEKNRVADVLVRLHLKNGETIWLLLHIEIQGYYDVHFAFRVHQMGYRIEDLFGMTPAMLCILTDDDPKFHPKQYVRKTWGSSHTTTFRTYKVMKNHPKKYKDMDSPISIIMEVAYNATKAKKMTDEDIMKLQLPIVRKLLSKGYAKEEISFLISFISSYVKFENVENNTIFDEKIYEMVDYETTEELLENFFNPEKRLLLQEKWFKEDLRERFNKEIEEKVAQAKLEAEREHEKVERSILLMLSQGIKAEIIAKILELPIEQIGAIQEKYKDNNPLKKYLNGAA